MSAIQVEDMRRRIALVYSDGAYARRNGLREKCEKLSLVVVWEREVDTASRMSLDGIDGLVLVTDGMIAGRYESLVRAAKNADVMVHRVSHKVSEWDDLRKWATRPFVIVKPNGASRVVDVSRPARDEAPTSVRTIVAAADHSECEALASMYAKDAERAKADLAAAHTVLADQRTAIDGLNREIATLKAAPVPDIRDTEAKRQAAEQRSRAAESELTESRRELKRLRDALEKAEEDRDAADAAAKQARKRPTGGDASKVVAALNVLVTARAMTADEAWDRVVEASK